MNRILIGAQWGDEGKGKVIDLLARKSDVIVRYQGGNNAGHTIKFNDQKFSENDIHKIISDLGYSTEKMHANKEAEKKLPKCCQPGGHADGHED